MPRLRTLSAGTLTGLYFIQKYRFLTIAQFARTAGFSAYHHAAEVLRGLERWGLIGYFGYVGIPGQGKAPKVYFLRRKGFDILCSENSLFGDIVKPFNEVQTTWTLSILGYGCRYAHGLPHRSAHERPDHRRRLVTIGRCSPGARNGH
jgi:hypothetical protein